MGKDSLAKSDTLTDKDKQWFDTTGFLSNCSPFMKSAYVGVLQGTNASRDSIFNLCFAPCYDCPETYEIIFVYKGGVRERKLMDYKIMEDIFRKGCGNHFSEFDCFAFVVPIRDPEKQDDMHALNMDFPLEVKVYSRIEGDKWRKVIARRVNSFEEYGDLQLNVIYKRV
ncbi:hypothetical protein SAMN04488505_11041 [Chitinophaga rupis]|uniref:Uncharacterized protein n=1 Tax=Chitinophaga rupis TaxID=573321 RepID=A0A1H8G5S0_9BACT|nr:hypothetical protein SAMN04488505_11041 [Chitinophaga rupis]